MINRIITGILLFINCSSVNGKDKKFDVLKDKFNTLIIVNLKNQNDAKFIPFQQYNKFRLDNFGIDAPPKYTEENKKLKKILRVSLDAPSLLLLGFNEIYIEPGDTVEVNYEVLFKSRELFKDTISVIRGNSIVIRSGGNLLAAFNNFVQELKTDSDSAAFVRIINSDNIEFLTEKFLKENKSLLYSTQHEKAIKGLVHQLYFSQLVLRSSHVYASLSANKKMILKNLLVKLFIEISNNSFPKYWPYWFTSNKIYNIFYKKNEPEKATGLQSAIAEFKDFDEKTKQFFYLLTLRNTPLTDSLTLQISSLITDTAFTKYKETVKKRVISSITNDVINNYILLDNNKNPVLFKEIFSKTSLPYLYLDFCGTWCKPCITEIAEYSVHQKFRGSKLLKPIWLFFENDHKSWLKIIEKYQLPAEDCYLLIKDEQLRKQFGIDYGWQGEFPHHFLFTKKGEILDNAAVSLILLDIEKYK